MDSPCSIAYNRKKEPIWQLDISGGEDGLDGSRESSNPRGGEYIVRSICGGGIDCAIGRICVPCGANVALDRLIPLASPARRKEGKGDGGTTEIFELS